MSWTAVSDTNRPELGSSPSVDSLAWAQLTAVTEQNDVDFRLKARESSDEGHDRPASEKLWTSVFSTP